MNAVAYLRVSTAEQATDGVSLDAQKERAAAWCKANGYALAAVYSDILSGARAENRPGLRAALEAACKGRAALVVYSLSRLARSVRDTLTIAERLDKAGADLVSLSEKIDTSSAAGKMLFRMLAVWAEFERDVIAERTRAALTYKRHQAERVGKVPFGYDLAADGIHLEPNAQEQNILALIRDLRADGLTLREIAAELTRRGVATKEGNTRWSFGSVARILSRAA